jgi:hypothetical protein
VKEPKYTDLHKYPHGYRTSNQTDIRETFARVIAEQRKTAEELLRKCIQMKRSK